MQPPLQPPDFIGPLKIKYTRPKANLEMICHFDNCNWSSFARTEQQAREILLRHIEGHIKPRVYVFDVERAPGR